MSSPVCVAMTVSRNRAVSRGTVGGRIAVMKMPAANKRLENSTAARGAFTTTGMIGVRESIVSNPIAASPRRTARVLSHSRALRSGSAAMI